MKINANPRGPSTHVRNARLVIQSMASLRSFIKSVRAAKTLSDERNIIQKESAAIRTSFRDERTSRNQRRQNVAKLLYLFTLGERTHFGQVECLKLLASPHFTDKRLGYLGTMLLLDENQEVLMLVTNSLDADLNHPNQYVISLALCTLGNIASETMARDLFQRVEKLITASNPYLKKKAALCALRVIRRVPEYEDIFLEHAKLLLTDQSHGVLLCGASLAIDMIDNNPTLVDTFKAVLPGVIQALKLLASTGYAPEYDVGGIPDPFLQTRLIRLLRAMGQDNPELSGEISDILATIATNTDPSKNVGNAVLYETVLAIFGIAADSSLRVLGINILAKFLTNKDNNTRYTALNTLLKVVELEPAAVQRHRSTVLSCLDDPDISIRRRALELSYALINAQNIRVMIKELLSFLEHCDAEFRAPLVSQIALNAERYAPTKRWHVDTLMRTFVLAGNYTKENVLSAFILLVISAPDLQLFATQKLYAGLKRDLSQRSLTLSALWLVGEYGDLLIKSGNFTDEDSGEIIQVGQGEPVVDVIEAVLASPFANDVVQEYAINSLIKLSARSSNSVIIESIRRMLRSRESSLNTEVQQRAVEYTILLGHPNIRKGVLAKMPPPEFGDDLEAQHAKALSKALVKRRRRPPVSSASTMSPSSDLLDLGDGGAAPAVASDVLQDLFSSSTAKPPPKAGGDESSAATAPTSDLLDVFAPNSASAASPGAGANAVLAWKSDEIKLSFSGQKKTPGEALLVAQFDALSQVSELNMLVAVPKSQHLSLNPLSRSVITPGSSATQEISITGKEGASIKLRLKISYKTAGSQREAQVDVASLPVSL